MEAHFVVYYSLRKGLGPDWIKKQQEIGLDDIELGTPKYEILDMIRGEFKDQMRRSGSGEREYIIEDIIES